MAARKQYSPEYKQEAVRLVQTNGLAAAQIARDLGINHNMLSRWCREQTSTAASKVFRGQGTPRDTEVAALKRELALVKKERDFLKEAAVFFAKTTK